jgi:hypothetical protein
MDTSPYDFQYDFQYMRSGSRVTSFFVFKSAYQFDKILEQSRSMRVWMRLVLAAGSG